MNNKMKAIYAGSFDPYTNGHHEIIKKACEIFETVYVVIAKNQKKERTYHYYDIKNAIEQSLMDDKIFNCEVILYNGLVAEFCMENNIKHSIRGLRNSMDFEYEENISRINKLIYPEMETIYLRSENAAISSSMVKELIDYDRDISKFVPKAIFDLIEESKK